MDDDFAPVLLVAGLLTVGAVIWYCRQAPAYSGTTSGALATTAPGAANLNTVNNHAGATAQAGVTAGFQVSGLFVGSAVLDEESAGDPGSGG